MESRSNKTMRTMGDSLSTYSSVTVRNWVVFLLELHIIGFIISDDSVGKNDRGRLLGWFGICNKAREDLVARSTAKNTNIAGRTEWNGDLELLLVEDKDNLVAKVGSVSTPVVMDLLAVVLGW
jgi:hypothetical protein